MIRRSLRYALALVVGLTFVACDDGGPTAPPDPTDPAIGASSEVKFEAEPQQTVGPEEVTITYSDLDETPSVDLPESEFFTIEPVGRDSTTDQNGDISGSFTYNVSYTAPTQGGASAQILATGVNSALNDTLETRIDLIGQLDVEPPTPVYTATVYDWETPGFSSGSSTTLTEVDQAAANSSGESSFEVQLGAQTGQFSINRQTNVTGDNTLLRFIADGDIDQTVELTFTLEDASGNTASATQIVSGGTGWSQYEIPLSEFSNIDGVSLSRANGGLLNRVSVEAEIISDGNSATFFIDELGFGTDNTTSVVLFDLEGPRFPGGTEGDGIYGDTGASATSTDVAAESDGTTSGQVTPNNGFFGFNYYAAEGFGNINIPLQPSDVLSFRIKSSGAFTLTALIEEFDDGSQEGWNAEVEIAGNGEWTLYTIPISQFGGGSSTIDPSGPPEQIIYNVGFEAPSSAPEFLMDDIKLRRNVGSGS